MIHSYGESSAGHSYFSLCEESLESSPEYALAVALFSGRKKAIDIDFELEDGLEIKILGKVDIYKPRSQIQMVMSQIDTSYTISKMAKDKELLLLRLKEEGILDLNKQKELHPLPLNVALVTSKNSAAHRDFEDELKKSTFGWQVSLIHTSVQGAAAPAEIVYALKKAAEIKPDVIALIRGGGSSIDLAAFDEESVSRMIAEMPVPVFSGIGHEIDTSVADYAAHTHTKTPTACAGALIALMIEAEENLNELFRKLKQDTRQILSTRRQYLTQLAAKTSHAPKDALSSALNIVTSFKTNLLNNSEHLLSSQKIGLQDKSSDLKSLVLQYIKRKQSELSNHKKHIDALNPALLLSRGWSITHTEAGELVRSRQDAPADTILITQVKDGKIESTVRKTK